MRQLKITQSITYRESQSIEKYLTEIGKVDLISAEEEVLLARRIKKPTIVSVLKCNVYSLINIINCTPFDSA